MPRIMTGPENQSQTHFMLEIRQPFRLISYWDRLYAVNSSPTCYYSVSDIEGEINAEITRSKYFKITEFREMLPHVK